ncbi:MAG: LysR family transcriptional regulator substrate-binding protein [Ardenticatenaceae bacterium]|nr:LysR family transcriptional regulator substrate-binding protein [Ardenticatenaceae bacterium]
MRHHSRQILTHVEAIRQAAVKARGLDSSKLRIGVVPTAPTRLLTGIVGDFERRYPNTDIAIFEGNESDLDDWLHSRMIDVAFTSSLHPQVSDNYVVLAKTHIKVLLPEDHSHGNWIYPPHTGDPF